MTNYNTTGRQYLVATDGACLGNPGPGGWGVIIHELNGETVVSRHALAGRADGHTTNQRMELTAAYEALKFIGGTSTQITILSDSQYLVNGMTQWLDGRKGRGWRTGERKPVRNIDLRLALDELSRGRLIHWEWTRGHAGQPLNEQTDMLANNAAAGVYGDPVGSLRDFHPGLFENEVLA